MFLQRSEYCPYLPDLKKKGKDPFSCSSYRPISLICTDTKVYAKVLARRLDQIAGSIISHDQTGFLKGRSAMDKVRRLLNIIDKSKLTDDQSAILSLDAEKAFDRVEWIYLWSVLKCLGFGPYFIHMVQTLYRNSAAWVSTGLSCSSAFLLGRDTRQGCPLSPLLFALSLEPLARAIRQVHVIAPIIIDNSKHHISLFADDILLYMSDTSTSIIQCLKIFNDLKKVSGYKINWEKSVLMPLSGRCDITSVPASIPVNNAFTYLGIQILPSLQVMVKQNYSSLFNNIRRDLERWGVQLLSLQGRIAIIKMNVLPRLLFLFNMIPLSPNKTFFKEINSIITKFIWNNKRPRIKLKTLQKTPAKGGLAFPNIQLYFWACQLRSLKTWLKVDSDIAWRNIESSAVHPHRLQDLLFTGLPKKVKKIDNRIVVD